MIDRSELTDRQLQLVKFFAELCASDGRPPTVREVMEHFGFKSTNTVTQHFRYIALKGYLEHAEPNHARGWRLTAEGRRAAGIKPHRCPHCGVDLSLPPAVAA